MQQSDDTTLPPPCGFSSWLDYAVATMDTRSAQLESIFDDSTGNVPGRDRIRAAAQSELDALRGNNHGLPGQFVSDIKQGLIEAGLGDTTEYLPD